MEPPFPSREKLVTETYRLKLAKTEGTNPPFRPTTSVPRLPTAAKPANPTAISQAAKKADFFRLVRLIILVPQKHLTEEPVMSMAGSQPVKLEDTSPAFQPIRFVLRYLTMEEPVTKIATNRNVPPAGIWMPFLRENPALP